MALYEGLAHPSVWNIPAIDCEVAFVSTPIRDSIVSSLINKLLCKAAAKT
jgi:hypothetical protein